MVARRLLKSDMVLFMVWDGLAPNNGSGNRHETKLYEKTVNDH
jgi:hypothetical protein